MARTKPGKLANRTNRLELPIGKGHAETISPGCYLVYHRPKSGGCGTWRARWRDLATSKIKSKALGAADDLMSADGGAVLTAAQAQVKAEAFFGHCRKAAARALSGEPTHQGAVTVQVVLESYIREVGRKGRELTTPRGIIAAHITPKWGAVEVSSLTKKGLQDWHQALSVAPRRKTGQKHSSAGSWGEEPPSEDQLRRRKSTANRILAVLTAALNLAAREELIPEDPAPWRAVHQFSQVKGRRLRFLDLAEQRALVAACPPDFRALVQAALHTGSRFGPLARLTAKDLDTKAGTLYIERDKGGGSRHIILAAEGLAWFRAQTKGKKGDEPMIPRPGVKRVSRLGSSGIWDKDDIQEAMRRACEAAKIASLTFHELRHTYASSLVNAGVPLAFVARQLGHADTRMVEQHYGHLAHTAMAESIRRLTPALGIGKPAKLKSR